MTNKDKIFGGFTPRCFYNAYRGWVCDQKKESFLFSLSENEKFDLVDTDSAIFRDAENDLWIGFGFSF